MSIPLDSANIYTDFQGLDDLRLSAEKHDQKALEAAARQFESLFIQQMLKSMRDASLAEGALDSDESRFYMDMFDKQLSLSMTQGEGIGLAKMIVSQLKHTIQQSGPESATQDQQHPDSLAPVPETGTKPFARDSRPDPFRNEASPVNNISTVETEAKPETNDNLFSTPEQFVTQVWPYAVKAGRELGVDPRVIVAQSALETGWGKHINRNAQGVSSNNLFNIKADGRWKGDTITKTTLEFHEGIPVQEKATFRAYDSIADSFEDYTRFIKTSPRYHDALRQAGNPEQYARELQGAGYATDPQYANKIMDIVNRLPLETALGDIKLSRVETIHSMDGS